jgi:hypothetical protein
LLAQYVGKCDGVGMECKVYYVYSSPSVCLHSSTCTDIFLSIFVFPRRSRREKQNEKLSCTFLKDVCGIGGTVVLLLGFDKRCGEWLASRLGHFTPGKTSAALVEEETEWGPEPFWTPCTRGKSFASSKD